jgi:STE24 endopeptidase
VISLLVKSSWFLESFGFQQGNLTQAILIFSLLGGTFSFWLNPLFNFVSRKHEFEADAFAAKTQKNAKHLIGSLRKLSEKNLSNLTPDNFYSRFYYSHPTLTERESALNSITP